MKVVLLTSCELRHAYLASSLIKAFDVPLIVREEKGLDTFYDSHPDKDIINEHFENFKKKEREFFGKFSWESVNTKVITKERGKLSSIEVASEIKKCVSNAVVVFGSGIIKEPLLAVLPDKRTFNLHQGLSPYYRGSGTNFWPFVEGRPDYIGVTVHRIDRGIDTGAIVAHGVPEISEGDTLHSLGCKTIEVSARLIVNILQKLKKGEEVVAVEQEGEGKYFKRSDLTREAIVRVRELEQMGICKEFISGKSKHLGPKLIQVP